MDPTHKFRPHENEIEPEPEPRAKEETNWPTSDNAQHAPGNRSARLFKPRRLLNSSGDLKLTSSSYPLPLPPPRHPHSSRNRSSFQCPKPHPSSVSLFSPT